MENEWVKIYIEYLKVGDFESMLDIKAKHFPNSFFKYRFLNACTLNCIKDSWLWMSEIDKLNDAFECSLLLNNDEMLRDLFSDKENKKNFQKIGFSDDELNGLRLSKEPFQDYKDILFKRGVKIPFTAEQQFERVRTAWEKDMAIMKETFRICSFSTTNESLLMWAHYADEYKGICLEYDFIDDEIGVFLQPVFYSDTRTSVRTFKEINSYSNLVASISKSLEWKYEKEWRLTFFTKEQIDGKNNQLNVPTPKAIYLGPRFELNSEEKKSELQLIAKNKNIPVFQMVIHKSEYKLIQK